MQEKGKRQEVVPVTEKGGPTGPNFGIFISTHHPTRDRESMADGLWQNIILQSVSKRPAVAEASIVLVGDRGSGKGKLVHGLCQHGACEDGCGSSASIRNRSGNIANGSSSSGGGSIAVYDHFDVDDTMSTNAACAQRVHMWAVDEALFDSCCEDLYGGTGDDQGPLMFAVVVDVSLPGDAPLRSLERWLRRVHSHCARHHSDRPKTTSKSPSGSFLSLPLLVVASNCDALGGAEPLGRGAVDVRKLFQTSQGQLRAVCLQVGAALIYTGTHGDTPVRNLDCLRSYIAQQLYPGGVRPPLAAADGPDFATFIPAGSDSVDLIAQTTGYSASDSPLLSIIAQESVDTTAATALATDGDGALVGGRQVSNITGESVSSDLADKEQVWLRDMQAYVSQEEVGGSSADPSVSARGGAGSSNEEAMGMQQARSRYAASITDSSSSKATSERKAGATEFFTSLLSPR